MILLACCLDVALVLFGAIGTVLHFTQYGWTMFRYYTLCSNVFLLLACAVQAYFEARILLNRGLFVPSWARLLKYFAVCTVTLTFFVVILILVPMAGGESHLPGYLLRGSGLYHHTLCPLLGLVSFVLLDRVSLPDRRVTLWALLPTALYGVAAIVLNLTGTLRGPYPFLRVREQPVWASAAWLLIVLALAWGLALLVWKLSLHFAAPRDIGNPDPAETAWTEDGYLKNQDALSAYTYRSIPANHNSCGPVAAYDLRRHEGHDVRFDDVLAEMDGMHLLRVPGPTFLYVMRRYLHKYLPGFHEARGRDAALDAMARSHMGILRYHEQRVPHFVAYFRADGGFRFFNVDDVTEDGVMSAAAFGEGHLRGGSVRLLYWE